VKGEKILIDTSVWISYFQNRDALFTEGVEEILTSSHVYVPKVVLAELIQGAKSEKEISVIEEFLEAFTIVDQTDDTWLGAGKLSFLMKKKGLTVHLIDCYIAVLANEHQCRLFSLDVHFKTIQKFLDEKCRGKVR
jgi:hypothetical protein